MPKTPRPLNSEANADAPPQRDLTVITTHVNADFDALASMMAASLLYPGAVTAFPGSQEKGLKNYFVQSAMYALNMKRPSEIDLDRVARLVLVDTRQSNRIGPLGKLLKVRDKIEIHAYDHHPPAPEDVTADFAMIEEVGSCTAMLIRELLDRNIEFDADQATLMAVGIYEDTGSFTFTSTTPLDLWAAGELIKRGADLNTVSSLIVRELDSHQIGLLNDLLNHMEHLRISGVDLVVATCQTDIYSPDFAVVVHKLIEMENVNVLFGLALMENRIYLVARSRIPDVDVSRIVAAFGGGGHPSAASATIKTQTLIEVRQKLVLVLESEISPRRTAREIMSYPVLSVEPDASLDKAHDRLTRYNINVLLVMKGEILLGQISRQAVEKGQFLGLGSMAVSEYMNPETETIPAGAGLPEIESRIIGRRLRIVPVVEEGRVVGVITRTDLMSIILDTPEPIPDPLYDSRQSRNFVRTKKVGHLMNERLGQDTIDLLRRIGRTADRLGYGAYAVGGFIRDLLLRRKNLDVDIVIEGDGIAFAREFCKRGGCRMRAHEKFGTAVVIFPTGYKLDVATARLEYYESMASLPIVEISSLKLDLYRRDFTVNTMAVKLNPNHFGTLIDYFSGQRDLKDRTIRVLHSLSLVEDPTRALRAIRFEQRFNFRIGKLTSQLINNAVRINAFGKVNPHRLHHELTAILDEVNPLPALDRMKQFHLLEAIQPGLKLNPQTDNMLHQVHTVLSWYDLLYLNERLTRWLVYFMALCSSLTDKVLDEFIDRLDLSEKHASMIRDARLWARKTNYAIKRRTRMSRSDLYHLIAQGTTEAQLWAMAAGESEPVRRAFSLYYTELIKVKPRINGDILKEMGYRPGPRFKKILEDVKNARLNGQVRTIEDEREYIVRRFEPDRT